MRIKTLWLIVLICAMLGLSTSVFAQAVSNPPVPNCGPSNVVQSANTCVSGPSGGTIASGTTNQGTYYAGAGTNLSPYGFPAYAGISSGTFFISGLPNAELANSSLTIGSTSVALGATAGTIAGLTLTSPTINGGALSGTFSGSPTFSGQPIFTNALSGTQTKCLGLDALNNLVVSTPGCGTGSGSSAFSALTGGTNTTAAMIVGTGASITTSGSGAINATSMPATGLTGTLQSGQFPALTGDVTTSAGSLATTLATVNSNVGSFTNANITVNAKGLITAAANGTGGAGTPVFFTGPITAGPANAYTQSATTPSGFTLTNGYVVRTAINATNTAASTLNVNSTGVTSIEKSLASGVSALSGGELQANHVYDFTYNSVCTCFIVINSDASAILAGTSTTITQAQWQAWSVEPVTAASQVITLPSATTIAQNGGLFIQAIGTNVTLTPQSTDAINNGSLGASVTLTSGGTYMVTTSGSAGATAFNSSGNGNLPASGVTPGTYTNSQITVNSQGILTAASSGTGAGGSTFINRQQPTYSYISYQPGLVTTLPSTKGGFHQVPINSFIDKIVGSANTLQTCTTNPTITVYSCAVGDTGCASPTTLGSVTVSATGTATQGAVTVPNVIQNSYVAGAITAGSCASANVAVTLTLHSEPNACGYLEGSFITTCNTAVAL